MSRHQDSCATCTHWQRQTSETRNHAGICRERSKDKDPRVSYDGVATYADYSCPKWEGNHLPE